MDLTEELLIEWTGLTGKELSIFYLAYKKQASNGLLHNDLEYLKQDILKFKTNLWVSPIKEETKVSSLIEFWESKITK